MRTILTNLFLGLRLLTALVAVSQYGGCNSSSTSDCYDYYGYDYYYCDYYYYDPFYPYYGYDDIYYSTVAPSTYGNADPTQEEQAPEAVVNVESISYIAKTKEAEKTGLTPADFEKHYPCGQGDEALVVCADDKAPADDSDRLMIMFKTEKEVPTSDPTYYYLLGFAFDADNDPLNNFVPPEAEAGDYFGNTDRWYKVTYSPTDDWKLEVLDASTDTPTVVESHARLVIQQNVVAIVIPAGEFSVKNPGARIGLLKHTGDYGLEGGEWTGLVYPKPGEPLITPNAAPVE
jgi:hypothetical protein